VHVASQTVPTPREVAVVDKRLAAVANGPLAFSVWPTRDIIVHADRYQSIQAAIEQAISNRIGKARLAASPTELAQAEETVPKDNPPPR
jgi:hypothetical protein